MPRKKQRRSWGSVTEVKRAKKYVLRWLETTPEGRKRKTETVYGTYREACNRLDAIHADVMTRGDDRRVMTIGEVAEKWWLPEIEERLESGSLKPATARLYKTAWSVHIKERWGNVPCDKVRQGDVQDWLDSMTKSMAKMATVAAQRIMDIAVMREEVDTNKFRAKYRNPTTGETRTKDVLTQEEAETVLAKLRGSTLEAPFILACFGGCRVAESLAVAVNDISFESKNGELFAVAAIHRQASVKNGPPREIGDMKNEQSNRVTVIPPPYSERLNEIHAARIAEGSRWIADRGDGETYARNTASKSWRTQWLKIGVQGKTVTMQNLRPSWRTMAEVEWKVSDRLLELMMGHKLPGVTGAHYIRQDGKTLVDAFTDEYLANYRPI